ncbi:MAG: hypothetical protein H7A46_02460 [Verrucomicrobiales bacterium]|nr:hypothetical protein [Verrucomicrobiales bacterium]
MSTVMGVREAAGRQRLSKKPPEGDRLRQHTEGCLSDEQMMAVAAEGARALDQREAAYAKRKAR